MIFRIDNIDKTNDLYMVSSDTGEQKCVSGFQIVAVMCNGYKFVNAKLTNKGFAVLTDKGTRYIQINGLTRQQLVQMHNIVEQEKQLEEAKKQQAHSSGKPTARIKGIIKKPITKGPSSYISGPSVTVGGVTYKNEVEMCKQHNRDYRQYKEMIKKGYTREEALGIVEARSMDEVAKEKLKASHVLDRMAYDRGEL